jgi:hypothetical protein
VRFTRDNVGLICRLVPKTEVNHGVKLVVGTTHILFNQRRRDIKLAQMSVFLAGRGEEDFMWFFLRRQVPFARKEHFSRIFEVFLTIFLLHAALGIDLVLFLNEKPWRL